MGDEFLTGNQRKSDSIPDRLTQEKYKVREGCFSMIAPYIEKKVPGRLL
jgi:hypothetical protein